MTTWLELQGICSHCGGWGFTGNLYAPAMLKPCGRCNGSGRATKEGDAG